MPQVAKVAKIATIPFGDLCPIRRFLIGDSEKKITCRCNGTEPQQRCAMVQLFRRASRRKPDVVGDLRRPLPMKPQLSFRTLISIKANDFAEFGIPIAQLIPPFRFGRYPWWRVKHDSLSFYNSSRHHDFGASRTDSASRIEGQGDGSGTIIVVVLCHRSVRSGGRMRRFRSRLPVAG